MSLFVTINKVPVTECESNESGDVHVNVHHDCFAQASGIHTELVGRAKTIGDDLTKGTEHEIVKCKRNKLVFLPNMWESVVIWPVIYSRPRETLPHVSTPNKYLTFK